MTGFQRRNDALDAAAVVEGCQRLGIVDGHVLGTSRILQPGVFGAHTRVVQPGRHRMRLDDLPVGILQHIGAVAVQHTRHAALQRGRMPAGPDAVTGGLHTHQLHGGVGNVRMEDADGIGAPAHGGNHHIRLSPRIGRHLHPALLADDGLEVAHQHRVRMRAGHRADDVEGVVDVRHPHPHRLVERVLQRLRARLHLDHLRTQQVHPVDVLALASGVDRAHVHRAFQPVARGHRGRGHPVLARTRLGDDALLAHAPRQQRLTDGVVDLVGPGVVEVLTLEVDLRPAQHLRPAPRVIDRTGPAHEVLQLVTELCLEVRIMAVALVGLAQLGERADQRLGDEQATIRAEMPGCIRKIIGISRHHTFR